MNDIKHIRILDEATAYWAFALRLTPSELMNPAREAWSSGGFNSMPYVLFMPIMPELSVQWDPFAWGNRTRMLAHDELQRHWADWRTGDVLDVRELITKGNTDATA